MKSEIMEMKSSPEGPSNRSELAEKQTSKQKYSDRDPAI